MFQFFSKWIVKMLRPLTSQDSMLCSYHFFFSCLLAIGALYTGFKCDAVEWFTFNCYVSRHIMHTVPCSLRIFAMNFCDCAS